jgi:hypothetical protein
MSSRTGRTARAAKLDETRKAMLERLEALAGKGAKATAR